jgi:folate-binding protein YgfZ
MDDPASIHLTGDRVLFVEGAGGRAWLNSILTADLRSPAPTDVARYTLLLNPKGGIVSDAWVVERASNGVEKLALVLPSARVERVRELLQQYAVTEELSITVDESIRVITLLGAARRELVTDEPTTLASYSSTRLGFANVDLWIPASRADYALKRLTAFACERGGGDIDPLAWSSARVVLGIPKTGIDFDESISPHEAGLEGSAVSFTKGCYLGQEVVARQHRLRSLGRRLVQFEIDGAESLRTGEALRDLSGDEVGRVTTVGPVVDDGMSTLALGRLKTSLAEPGARVSLGARTARVRHILRRPESPAS